MSKITFVGGVAYRKYTAGYNCEHCGKQVEWESRCVNTHGQNVETIGSTTRVRLNEYANRDFLEAKAKSGLDSACRVMENNWRSGQYPDNIYISKSKCPHCKKRQHWAYAYSDMNLHIIHSPTKKVAWGPAFLGLFLGFLLMVIPVAIWERDTNILLACLLPVGGFFIFLFGAAKLERNYVKKLLDEKAQFENMKLTLPKILSWGESSTYTTE